MKNNVYSRNSEIQNSLNILLSDMQLYYQNLRAFHWLVKGPQFFEMHAKFEEFYTQVADDIDAIAERILMVGGSPLHTFEDYLETSNIKSRKNLEEVSDIVPVIINNLEYLLTSYRAIGELASEIADQGTTAMMDDFIGVAEKQLWMMNSLQIRVGQKESQKAAYAG